MAQVRKSPVVDIDAHYFEDIRGFGRYLDEPWQTRIQQWSSDVYAPSAGVGKGGPDPHLQKRIDHRQFPFPRKPDDIPEVMEWLGVDFIVLLPNDMLTLNHVSDRRRAVALCTGFIENMLEEVAKPDLFIYTTLCLPPQDIETSVRLLERYGSEEAVSSVCLMTDGPLPFPFGDTYYDPIYDLTSNLDLPIMFHSGFGGAEGAQSGLGLQSYGENHLGFVVNNQVQLTSVVMQGVTERFPRLKLIWEEAGVFWVPLMMFRLDAEYSRRRSEHTALKKPPSEYIKTFFFGTQPLEQVPDKNYFKYVFEMIDAEKTLMFATDWPHHDFDHPRMIRRLSFLTEEAKQRILGLNALDVLRVGESYKQRLLGQEPVARTS